MRAWLPLLLLLAAAPAAAQGRPPAAQRPGDSGLVLGVRGGWGVPVGEVEGGRTLRDLAPEKLPLWAELGYRFDADVQGALYFELAPASVARALCPPGACSASDTRVGVAVQLHLRPRARVDPWVGLGIGLEVLRVEVDDPDLAAPPGRSDRTWTGVELPLEAGIDLRATRRVTLGPYLCLSLGAFTSYSEDPEGGSRVSRSIDDRAVHGWVQAGLKGTLRL